MKDVFRAALVAGTLGTAVLVMPTAASASHVTVGFDVGNVAFAYTDGYWDRDHRWHRWHSHHDRDAFRRDHGDNFHAWGHDRDSDHGWHDDNGGH